MHVAEEQRATVTDVSQCFIRIELKTAFIYTFDEEFIFSSFQTKVKEKL